MLAIVTCVLIAVPAAACSRPEPVDDIVARSQAINATVMCPVCPGESIDQSQNPLAERMRGIVLDRLERGWTEKQIKDHFVESYGDSVLLSPPARGISILVWVLPPVGIALTAGALVLAMRAMRRGREDDEVLSGTELTDDEYADYADRISSVLTDRRSEQ